MNDPVFSRLLRNTCIALFLCTGLVSFCYFVVDRPFAYFAYDKNNFGLAPMLKSLTYPPPVLETWVPLVLVLLMVRRSLGPLRRWELSLLAASVSLVLAGLFRNSLARIFGRTWPETWINDNPSLISDGVYGFHFFHRGEGYTSFPSGHTARTAAAAAVFWVAYPRSRWPCIVVVASVAVGLLGMNYHFVSDVIAGGLIGSIVGTYAAYLSGLRRQLPVTRDRPAP